MRGRFSKLLCTVVQLDAYMYLISDISPIIMIECIVRKGYRSFRHIVVREKVLVEIDRKIAREALGMSFMSATTGNS